MTERLEAEVLVVGGGPAGAACALTLARLGRSVVLCEAARFPRDHVGICLSPGIARQLDFLGIRHILEHPAHAPALPVELRWGSSDFATAPSPAFIADRGRLDQDLLAAAADRGVRVLQPAKVHGLVRDQERWQADVVDSSGPRTIGAAHVVDARGRSSRDRASRTRLGPATIALRGIWRGRADAVVRIGTATSSWSWTAPIGGGRRLAIAFTAPRTLRQMGGSVVERYARLLDEAGVCNPGLELVGEPELCDATPFLSQADDRGRLLIGEADAALDPLSSSGVQAAIQSALRTGPVVNTLLTPSADHDAAVEYWNARRSAQASTHRTWCLEQYAAAFHAHANEFWRVRATPPASIPASVAPATPLPLPGQRLKLTEGVKFVHVPCLVGGLVVRATALSHPNLPEPVAFMDGVPVRPLLEPMSQSRTAAELVREWRFLSPEKALALLGWAWRNKIAVAG